MTRVGIDIGGSSIKLATAEGCATSPRYHHPSRDDLVRTIRELAGDAGATSVGLCLPGRLGPDGETVGYSANIPTLNGLHAPTLVREALGDVRVRVLADALAAARGSWDRQPVQGRLLALSLGTGVGAALLDDGEPTGIGRGTHIGHVGQMDVSLAPDAPIGPDGGRGSLEAYIGLPALRQRFGDDAAAALASLPDDDPALRALARAIRVCLVIYTPDHVRLLGGVGIAFAPKLPVLRRLIEDRLSKVVRTGWTLAATDDPYLAALGARSLAP